MVYLSRHMKSSMSKLLLTLDRDILKTYAFWTTVLFAMLGIYYLVALPPEGFFRSVHIATVQAYGMMLFVLVLISTVVGMIFHHLINPEQRARNTFAFIFSVSSLKFLASWLVFDVYLF